MQTQTLRDGAESFTVSVHEAKKASRVVLFSVGAGGLCRNVTRRFWAPWLNRVTRSLHHISTDSLRPFLAKPT